MDKSQHYRRFVLQALLVQKHFPGFKCRLRCGRLECAGDIQPSDDSDKYSIRVQYEEWKAPKVRILKPHIEPSTDIHMYRDGTLCLYHPPTQPWSGKNDLHKTIIPWTSEWLVYYELYQTEKKWMGPAIPHGPI